MTGRWAAALPADRALEVARLWARSGVDVCAEEERVWLRGDAWDEDLDRSLRAMLGSERFRLLSNGRLVPVGRAVPNGRLPEGPWVPLQSWLLLTAPRKEFPGSLCGRASLRLVRSDRECDVNLLLVPFAEWRDYAVRAQQVRLKGLSFAASDDGMAIVRGAPAPPIRGTCYVEVNGVAAPAGWTWRPQLDADVIRRVLELQQDDLALLNLDGTCDVIGGDAFVQAFRSAVRLTEQESYGA